jgi:hypothetical protein
VVLYLVGVALLVLRRPDVLTSPKLWAEDGAIFMKDAFLQHGYRALLAPYSGVVLVVPRLWAEFTTVLPVRLVPASYAAFSLLLDTASLAVVLSRRFSWLMPSFKVRASLFVALVLLPGTWEIHGNLTNSIWYTGLCLLFLSFATDPQTGAGRALELVVCLLFAFTGAESLVVAPLFALRWWRTRTRHSAVVMMVVGAGGLFQLVEVRLHPRTPAQLSSVGPWGFARTFVERVGGTAALGERRLHAWWPSSHTTHHAAALAVGLVLLGTIAVLAVRWVPRPALITFGAAMALLLGAATFGVVGSFRQLNDPAFSGRYFVAPVALLFLTVAVAAPAVWNTVRRRSAWLVFLPIAILAFGTGSDARLSPLPQIGWSKSARCIASHQSCHVPLNPPGWFVDLPPVSSAH